MALSNDFYIEITQKEIKWAEMIKQNLLNVIYCNLELKPFYIEKKNELEEEYIKTGNVIIGDTLFIIKNIINKLEEFNTYYKETKPIDFKLLLPLFLANQMNNSLQSSKSSDASNSINRFDIINNQKQYDYLYEDFPEEHKKVI